MDGTSIEEFVGQKTDGLPDRYIVTVVRTLDLAPSLMATSRKAFENTPGFEESVLVKDNT
jgi:hypothetical protein